MGAKISDEMLVSGMETFLQRMDIIDTNIDGGLINTKIGELDGRGCIYIGVEDTNMSIYGKASRGSYLKKVESVPNFNITPAFTNEAMKALEVLSGTEKESLLQVASEINTFKKLIYPFNFCYMGDDKDTKQDVVKESEIYLHTYNTAGYVILRIMCKYDESLGRCPLEYMFGTKNGNIVQRGRLEDYLKTWYKSNVLEQNNITEDFRKIISFSTANYIKTIVFTDKKGSYKLIFDCTGLYYESNDNIYHYSFLYDKYMSLELFQLTIKNVLLDFDAPKKVINYIAGSGKEKRGVLKMMANHQRFIVPYGCGDKNTVLV